MKPFKKNLVILFLSALALSCSQLSCEGCEGSPPNEPGEQDPAGDYKDFEPSPESQYPVSKRFTNSTMLNREVFSPQIETGRDYDLQRKFSSGNAFFSLAWIEAPSTQTGRQGLGPLFNSTACSACHFKDGRGNSPTPDAPDLFVSMLVRISVPHKNGLSKPSPIYGDQLQPFGISKLPANKSGEAYQTTKWETVKGVYDDGTPYELIKPTVVLSDFKYGEPQRPLYTSPRVAPQLIGMGFLEAIPIEDLLKKEDPDDKDGDGISGRLIRTDNDPNGKYGRFGWKAEQPTLEAQNAAAFSGDMGLTSRLHPNQACTVFQPECTAAVQASKELEVADKVLDRVTTYVSLLSVPIRRSFGTDSVVRGERLFRGIGCADCHTPSYVTGDHPIKYLSGVKIFPYTDLLVHDMGEDLSDGRPPFYEGGATATEWRTPPLWGIGLIPQVNKHNQLLHDGRARGVEEAVLWHGGEAEAARNRFKALSAEDRRKLVMFVKSL